MFKMTYLRILSLCLSLTIATSALMITVYYVNYEKQSFAAVISLTNLIASDLNNDENAIENFVYESSVNRLSIVTPNKEIIAESISNMPRVNLDENEAFESAVKNGKSKTVFHQTNGETSTYSYAIKLEDGNILVADLISSGYLDVFIDSIPFLILIMLSVFSVTFALSGIITKSTIRPITELSEHLDDIENVQTEKELLPFVENVKEQNRLKEELDKEKKQFTANVSHELKTPLTSIAGYAELIETGIAKEEDIKPFAHTIRTSANRLVSLAEDIIQLSQLDESKNTIEFDDVDLFEIAKETKASLDINAKQKNISIEVFGVPATIKAKKSLIEELVYNLCDNAIRYNKENGFIKITVNNTENEVTLIIRDSGIGIAKENQEKIFDRFYRVDKSRSKETGGTGLGLAIVKNIVDVHNAEINVESALYQGTTFTITFKK